MLRKDGRASPATFNGAVLIVEKDEKSSFLLSINLEREGFKTIAASDGQQALELARQYHPIFVILGVELLQTDGWQVCRELRQSSDVPILILTTKGKTHERIMGLTLGADDCVERLCCPEELIARVKAILRRARPELSPPSTSLSHRGLILDREKRKVTLHGHGVSLTPSEYRLLQALMSVKGRVFLRNELLDYLYSHGEAVVDRVIDVHIGNLRQKIEEDPSKPRYILTARGLGYQFADGDEEQDGAVRRVADSYRSFFVKAITGIYQTTLGGRYVMANPMLARMFGYKSAEKLIENTPDLNEGFYVERDRRAEFICLIREHNAVSGFESQVYRRDGSVMWIAEHALAVCDAAGSVIGFQGVTIDITERKAMEEALTSAGTPFKPVPPTYY